MPPPIPVSFLKAVCLLPPRHPHHCPVPFLHPSHVPVPVPGRSRTSFFSWNRPSRWWMRPGSGDRGARSPGARQLAAAAASGSLDRDGKKEPAKCLNEEGEGVVNGFHREQRSLRLLTLPTVLTIGRVAAIPLLVSTFYVEAQWAPTVTTSIFLAAAITDWLDGYIARKMQLGTAFGAFLDPVADKLMVAATLVLLCSRPLEVAVLGQVPWLFTIPSIAVIGREITMSAVREWAASQNSEVLQAVAVNKLGKWKTATQMTALTILLTARDAGLTGQGFVAASGVVLLYISAGLGVWSLAVYMSKIWRFLMKQYSRR